MSIVIGGVVFQNGIESKSAVLYASLEDSATDFLGSGASANVILIQKLSSAQQLVVKMTYSTSFAKYVDSLYICLGRKSPCKFLYHEEIIEHCLWGNEDRVSTEKNLKFPKSFKVYVLIL